MAAEAQTVTSVWAARLLRWLPGSVLVATAALVVLAVAFALRDPTPYDPTISNATAPILVLLVASLATVGALLALRRATNPIGWMLLASAPLLAGTLAASAYTHYAVATAHDLSGTDWVAWSGVVSSTPGLALMGLVILMFPSGRLPGHGRVILAVLLAGIALNTISAAFRPGLLVRDPPIANPVGIEGLGDAMRALETVGVGLLLIGVVAATASLVERLHSATGDERKQLEWFAFVAVVVAAALALTVAPPIADVAWAVALAAFAGLPIAIAVAIMKYRLYDIDKLISRTLVYLPLIGILGGLYAACVALFQRLFVSLTGDTSDAAVVLTTLIVAGTFTPVRKNLEAAVDRSFKPVRDGSAPAVERALSPAPADVTRLLDDPRLTLRIEEIARRIAADSTHETSAIDRSEPGGSPP